MVRCADCGFLAFRDRNYQLMEAPFETRAGKAIPSAISDWHPICFMRKTTYEAELPAVVGDIHVFAAIGGQRDCDAFTPWQQGFTPKEHLEWLRAEERRRWEAEQRVAQAADAAKRDDADRKWREKQREEDLAWRAQQEKKANERHRRELWVLGGAVTLAVAVASIASALIQSWDPF